ncbi:HesA/MoeB/ThiF family protein [Candidatus Rariloculus sp.]|uniref:HesA/MoeB/ThiF family protein n=1 Tax=Candidatus Rariloculus sp. TaxID=3101265 RepID=UPI003D143E86
MTAANRYARHVALVEVGEQGQARLAQSTIVIVGLGGLGCPAAQFLATSGIGRLVLNDFDRVDETNLPRQILFGPDDVGELKVEAAGRRLKQLNPDIEITCLADRLNDSALAAVVAGADAVLDCTDNFTARLAINGACVSARVPLVSGAAIRFEGQIAVFSNASGGPCYRCVYDDEDEWLGTCQGNGVLAPVPGVIGAMMATETLGLAIGMKSALDGKLLLWDAIPADWQRIAIKPNPDCPTCRRA